MTDIIMKPLPLVLVLLAAACSQQPMLNYRHCLKLRIGMTREQLFQAMGQPEETIPYVEGKSLPHLKGRTSYEWSTPSSMPASNAVSVDDAAGTIASIRCGDSVVTAAVFVEPPEPAVSAPPLYGVQPGASTSTAPSPPRRRGLTERSGSSAQSRGGPLTQ